MNVFVQLGSPDSSCTLFILIALSNEDDVVLRIRVAVPIFGRLSFKLLLCHHSTVFLRRPICVLKVES